MATTTQQDDDAEGESTAAGGERGDRSGTRYPFYNLEEAEKFARAVQASGGNEVLEDDLLKHLQLSRTTKSWIYKLSTAREFGLVERKGQKTEARIVVTDLGKRVLLPGDHGEQVASRIESFLTPPLYKKLFERYKGAPVPQASFLANLLVREHKILGSVAENAATAFIDSAKYAELVNGSGLLNLGAPGTGRKPDETPRPDGEQPALTNAPKVDVPANFIAHVFQLRKNLNVTIPLPSDLTKRDVERLHKWMETLPIEEEP